MHYINLRFTYLFTYFLTYLSAAGHSVACTCKLIKEIVRVSVKCYCRNFGRQSGIEFMLMIGAERYFYDLIYVKRHSSD